MSVKSSKLSAHPTRVIDWLPNLRNFCLYFHNFRGLVSLRNSIPVFSAGVGRTGTYIVVDWMLSLIERELETIDIYNSVAFLRTRRRSMVQTQVSLL